MGMFLNSIEPYDKYKTITKGLYFVDKTELLEELIPALEQEQRFFCITRPRRFGKTVMANMIASFFEKSEGGSDIFDRLKISEYPKYKEQINMMWYILISVKCRKNVIAIKNIFLALKREYIMI